MRPTPIREQADTIPIATEAVMSDPLFARGLTEIRGGKPFDPTCNDWNYERGRMFGSVAPLDMPLRIKGKLNRRAVWLLRAAFSRGYII